MKKLAVIFSIILSLLIVRGVFAENVLQDSFIINRITKLIRLSTYFNQFLIGDTATYTDYVLEVHDDIWASDSIRANQFCINTTTPDCITAWPAGGSGGSGGSSAWEFYDAEPTWNAITPTTTNASIYISGNATTTGSIDASQYCLSGTNCITAWPSGATAAYPINQWLDTTNTPTFVGLNASSTNVDSLVIYNGITLGGVYRNTWPAASGSSAGSWWATSSNSLIGYPDLAGDYSIVIGAAATTSEVKFEVNGSAKIGTNLIVGTELLAPAARLTVLNSTTTNIDNLTVYSSVSLPNNSITDAMVADTITASNYLSLVNWFATTTHANIASLPSLSITESQISDLSHYTDADTGNYIDASSTIQTYFSYANLANSWGNHATAGYLTYPVASSTYLSLTNWFSTTTHANISSLPSLSITESQISDLSHYTDADTGDYIDASTTIQTYFSNAATAFLWGNHATAGYLTSITNLFDQWLDSTSTPTFAGLRLSGLATPAGSFLAVDPDGDLIATTTPSGSGGGAWSTDANGIYYNSGNVGIGTTPDSSTGLTVHGGISSPMGDDPYNEAFGKNAYIDNTAFKNTTVIGYGASARSGYAKGGNTVIGAWATSTHAANTIIGSRSRSSAGYSVVIGADLLANSANSVLIGSNASISNGATAAIGYSAVADESHSVAIGQGVNTDKQNQFVFGTRMKANAAPVFTLQGAVKAYTPRNIFEIGTEWIDLTDETRQARVKFLTGDYTGALEFMRAETKGGTVDVSFPNLAVATTTPWSGYELAVAGDGVFTGNLYVMGNATSSHFAASEICLNGSCRTSWPTDAAASSFWQYNAGLGKAISPTSTDIGLFVTASSTVAANFRVDGQTRITGHLYAGTNLYVGQASNGDNDFIYFDAGAEYLVWNNTSDLFVLSNDLSVTGYATTTAGLFTQGNLRVGGNATTTGSHEFTTKDGAHGLRIIPGSTTTTLDFF